MVNEAFYNQIIAELKSYNATLIAVSKTKSASDILELYHLGQRDFGENYVQELVEKCKQLPEDIRWHFIGHLQSNKVKQIAPFIHLIQSVDSLKLLKEINKQALANNLIMNILLQYYSASEETKFGLDDNEIEQVASIYFKESTLKNIRICGVMGMATNTDNKEQITKEFTNIFTVLSSLKDGYFKEADYFNVCSMGMSDDYQIALKAGSTMIRIGRKLFGERTS